MKVIGTTLSLPSGTPRVPTNNRPIRQKGHNVRGECSSDGKEFTAKRSLLHLGGGEE